MYVVLGALSNARVSPGTEVPATSRLSLCASDSPLCLSTSLHSLYPGGSSRLHFLHLGTPHWDAFLCFNWTACLCLSIRSPSLLSLLHLQPSVLLKHLHPRCHLYPLAFAVSCQCWLIGIISSCLLLVACNQQAVSGFWVCQVEKKTAIPRLPCATRARHW